MTPEQYLKTNDLWDLERLKQHAQHNNVCIIESSRFPGLVMLHYMDSCTWENNWSTFARMSRGLILDMQNQKILAHPFEKFFNVAQVPETSYENLKELGKFQASEKLDGSMCILFRVPTTGEYRLTTKGSFDSEHGEYATSLLTENLKQPKWVEEYTLMFELVTKRFQIVIDYPKRGYKEGLYLIGAREKATGRLLSYIEIQGLAAELGLLTFVIYYFDSLDQLLDNCKTLPIDQEGFVIRFQNDLLVKVKGIAYLEMHRFISHLSDKNILQAVADGTASNLAELAPEEYRQDVLDKIAHFQKRVAELEGMCYTLYSEAPKEGSRKDFALWVNDKAPAHLQGFMFQLLDHRVVDRKHMFRVLEEIDNIDGRTRI